jgi:hypothetical protein
MCVEQNVKPGALSGAGWELGQQVLMSPDAATRAVHQTDERQVRLSAAAHHELLTDLLPMRTGFAVLLRACVLLKARAKASSLLQR